MIVIETVLEEIFKQLPAYVKGIKPFPIKYSWGNQADLILHLNTEKGNNYPLVWLVADRQSHSLFNHSAEARLKLILAKDSENQTSRNPVVWNSEFVDCLNPLLANVLKALSGSGVTSIVNDGEYDVFRDANYTEEDLAKATDFWNVIVLDITVRFEEKSNGEPKCINNNIFK